MAVISLVQLNNYRQGNLFDLIHNHMSHRKKKHLVVTNYENNKKPTGEPSNSSDESQGATTASAAGNHDDKQHDVKAPANQTDKPTSAKVKNSKPTASKPEHEPRPSNPKSSESSSESGKTKPKTIIIDPADLKTGSINLDTNITGTSQSGSKKPHPKMTVIKGDPVKAHQVEPSEDAKPKPHSQGQATNTNPSQKSDSQGKEVNKMTDIKDKIMHKKIKKVDPEKKIDNEDTIFKKIQEAAATATYIEETKVHVKLSANIDKLPTKQIDVLSLEDNSQSYIPLDAEFFHLLGFAVIGKNLDVILTFRDGTELRIAPESFLKNKDKDEAAVKKTLLANNYNYVYQNVDIEKLGASLKMLSSHVFNTDKYSQYWIEFLPMISKQYLYDKL